MFFFNFNICNTNNFKIVINYILESEGNKDVFFLYVSKHYFG